MSATGASNELGLKGRSKTGLPQILDPSALEDSSPCSEKISEPRCDLTFLLVQHLESANSNSTSTDCSLED